jgi:feruloyl esterase
MCRRIVKFCCIAALSPFIASVISVFQLPTQAFGKSLSPSAQSCEALMALTLPNTTITSAKLVAAGAFSGPQDRYERYDFTTLPAFCRVTAVLKPTSDSDIKIEVWMPTNWNNKFEAVGNGGWAGSILNSAMAAAVGSGYATASTDTGHQGNSASFALGHPEKLIDFSYRAIHEMTVQAKSIISAFYGKSQTVSFFNGCSLGGHQGLTEADKFPADFDAIVSGDPALNWARLHIARVWINSIVHRSENSYIPPAKYPMIHDAVLGVCDAMDGVKDGVLEDPTRCHFNPKVLECKGEDTPTCLTTAQVETAQALYGPVKSPKTGAQVQPVLLQPGSELTWATLAGPEPLSLALDAFKYLLYKDPQWDWRHFNPATDLDAALGMDTGFADFNDATLKPFFDRGGKLLMYHGWSDQQIPAMGSVEYFNRQVKELGRGIVGKSIELYMVPGMYHCRGGPGTDTFDKMAAIEKWVSTGKAPDQILASHLAEGKVDRTRPLCKFGNVAAYKGSGSTDDAANFSCREER